jgi:hypothetical protein
VTLFRLEVTRPDGERATLYDAHLPEDVGEADEGGESLPITENDLQRAEEGRLPRRVDIVIEVVDHEVAWQLPHLEESRRLDLIDREATRLTAAVSFMTQYAAERGR